MIRIFLCHATEDKPQVREVYQRLKAEGFEPWLDEEDLLPGQLWDQEIRRALRESDFILIFFSRNSVAKRGYVQREMKLALDVWEEIPEGTIFAIPIRLDDCEIPEQFRKFQWVNLFEERAFENIVRAIRAGLAKPNLAEDVEIASIPMPKEHIVQIVLESDARRDWSHLRKGSKNSAVYNRDVNLRFEIDDGDEGVQQEHSQASWANRHPDHCTGQKKITY